MTLDEALALYLYLKDQAPGDRNERMLAAAWGVICASAMQTIKRDWPGQSLTETR